MQKYFHVHWRLFVFSVACICGTNLPLCAQPNQPQMQAVGCTTDKQGATCDKAAFQRLFTDARTVWLGTQPVDRMAAGQLTQMAGVLGKTFQTSESAPDVSLLLTRNNTDGVMIGPAGAALATLSVYGPGAAGRRGDLIWLETFTSQPDMSWPAVVHALLQQFQGRLVKR